MPNLGRVRMLFVSSRERKCIDGKLVKPNTLRVLRVFMKAHSLIALYVNNVNHVELLSMLLQHLDGCVIISPVADDVNLS